MESSLSLKQTNWTHSDTKDSTLPVWKLLKTSIVYNMDAWKPNFSKMVTDITRSNSTAIFLWPFSSSDENGEKKREKKKTKTLWTSKYDSKTLRV